MKLTKTFYSDEKGNYCNFIELKNRKLNTFFVQFKGNNFKK